MKVSNACFFMLLVFWLDSSQAYIPSSKMILTRVAENSLRSPLYVEQELTVKVLDQSVTVLEQWLFQDENNFQLIVRGEKELKDQILFRNQYGSNKKSTSLLGATPSSGSMEPSKNSLPLMERILFIKSTQGLMRALMDSGVVGPEITQSENFKQITTQGQTNFQFQPEAFLRLGRTNGGISYIFGPKPTERENIPGFWVEQDQFVILKWRDQRGREIRMTRPTVFSRGARWPKEIIYRFDDGRIRAQSRATAAQIASSAQKQLFQKVTDKRTSEYQSSTGRALIEEFYQKFR